jgi:hypothetical protein
MPILSVDFTPVLSVLLQEDNMKSKTNNPAITGILFWIQDL